MNCEHRKGEMVNFDEDTFEGSWKCRLCGEVFSRKASIVCMESDPDEDENFHLTDDISEIL